jgi:hypothetical protein
LNLRDNHEEIVAQMRRVLQLRTTHPEIAFGIAISNASSIGVGRQPRKSTGRAKLFNGAP